ncbi:hypothetical protein Pelo_984 [Pelomyxa schiedti]|nr:hypothetical protein Pelo_984 [Pelomyxa schiedti]
MAVWTCTGELERRTGGVHGLALSYRDSDNRVCWANLFCLHYEEEEGGELCPDKKQFGLGYDKFLFFFVDGLPFDIATKHGITNGKLVHTYRVRTYMHQYTAAIMTSYMAGVPQINVMGNPILSDNLLHQIIHCNGTKKPPVAFYKMKKQYDLTWQLFSHNHDWVRRYPYKTDMSILFPSILDNVNLTASRLDNITNHASNSVMGIAETLDRINHNYGKFSKKTAKYVSEFAKGIESAKKWVDKNDEYLLIVTSDHGGTWAGDKSGSDHGPELGGNEAFVSLYNPHLPEPPQNKNTSEYPLILVTDVASTLSQYLSCASIPLSSFGIPFPAYEDPLYTSRLQAQNAYQLLQNILSNGGTVPASVDSSLSWKKVGPLQAVIESLKKLSPEDAREYFLALSKTLSGELFRKTFPLLYFAFLTLFSLVLSLFLYFRHIKFTSHPELLKGGILCFLFVLSTWMGLCLSGMNAAFPLQKQFQGFASLPSVFIGLIAVVDAISRMPPGVHCENFFAVIAVGWLLSWRLTIGIILNSLNEMLFSWNSMSYFVFSLYILCELIVAQGKKTKIYVLSGAALCAIALYKEAPLLIEPSLDIYVVVLCFVLFIVAAIQPLVTSNLTLWHFPMVIASFILYQQRDRIELITAQLPAFFCLRAIATRNAPSRVQSSLLAFFALSLGYSCHISLGRDFDMTEALLTWPWLPFPTEIPTFLGGSVLMLHKFASFLLVMSFAGQAFGTENSTQDEPTLPLSNPNVKPTFQAAESKSLLDHFYSSDLVIWFTLFAHTLFSEAGYKVSEFVSPEEDTAFINSMVLLVCTIILGLPLVRRLLLAPLFTRIVSAINVSVLTHINKQALTYPTKDT